MKKTQLLLSSVVLASALCLSTIKANGGSGNCTSTVNGASGMTGKARYAWRQSGDILFLSRVITWSDKSTGRLEGSVSRSGSTSGDPLTVANGLAECKGWW